MLSVCVFECSQTGPPLGQSLLDWRSVYVCVCVCVCVCDLQFWECPKISVKKSDVCCGMYVTRTSCA